MNIQDEMSVVPGIIAITSFFTFVILFLNSVLKKNKLHFEMLKKLYPNDLEHLRSWPDIYWGINSGSLDIGLMFWLRFPVYLTWLKPDIKSIEIDILDQKLRKDNWALLIYFIFLISSVELVLFLSKMLGAGWILLFVLNYIIKINIWVRIW